MRRSTRLGPAYVWRTPVYLGGPVVDGALRGNLYIQGQGDPKLVLERLWLMLRRLQGMGIKVIVGDIVLDRSAFQLPAHDAAVFDNEPWRPYNASPDALLINYKAVALNIAPDAGAWCRSYSVRSTNVWHGKPANSCAGCSCF